MRLDKYKIRNWNPGQPYWCLALWFLVSSLLFSSWIPGSKWRRALLRFFGANVGKGVVIKPRTKIKFPWRFSIGDYSWIGEGAWIDNLGEVSIGKHVCISQGVYLCTGNHDYKNDFFDLIVKKTIVQDQCWLGAFSKIAPGVTIRKGSVVGFGSVLLVDTKENGFYLGHPAQLIKDRYLDHNKASE